MQRDKNRTVVIFRAYPRPEGQTLNSLRATPWAHRSAHPHDLIAVFPMQAGCRPGYCGSYQIMGQHGECDASGVIAATVAIPDTVSAPLRKELERIGYNLLVRRRLHPYYWWATASKNHRFLAKE